MEEKVEQKLISCRESIVGVCSVVENLFDDELINKHQAMMILEEFIEHFVDEQENKYGDL